MATIEIDEQFQDKISPELLLNVVQAVFLHQKISEDSGVTVQISDDTTLKELNLQYLGIDAPTDVLSFPLPFDDPETGGKYLGDIIISFQKASEQANAGNHAVIEEIKLLIVHGMLHLIGYDHSSPDEKAEMWQIQDQLLTALGIDARPSE